MSWLSGMTLAAAGGMSACSKPATPSAELSRDLQAASAAPALALAPTSGSQDVVSAVEQAPRARRAPAPSRVQLVSHAVPAATAPAPIVAPPAAAPVSTPVATVATTATVATAPGTSAPVMSRTPGPRPIPVQPAHQGRYKTEAEVFRDAPFPINP